MVLSKIILSLLQDGCRSLLESTMTFTPCLHIRIKSIPKGSLPRPIEPNRPQWSLIVPAIVPLGLGRLPLCRL